MSHRMGLNGLINFIRARLASETALLFGAVTLLAGYNRFVLLLGTNYTFSCYARDGNASKHACLFPAYLAARLMIPEDSRLVEIPLDPHHNLLVLYIIKNERVDQAIRLNGWRTFPVVPPRVG